jgi:hypothetical protein
MSANQRKHMMSTNAPQRHFAPERLGSEESVENDVPARMNAFSK